MGEPAGPVEALLRRQRVLVLTALAAVTALCWIHLVGMAREMDSMGGGMPTAGVAARTPLELVLLLWMWVVMMVGMMLPSAAPMILLYARVAGRAASDGTALAPTGLFALGYLGLWTAFSVGATGAQWGLERLALLSPAMSARSPALGAGLLVAAGLYQLSPWKDRCLRHCRAPAHFLSRHWRPGRLGALAMGARHGAFCLGCCWVLMGLLFVGGVMNLLWVAAIAVFVLLEKLAPGGRAAGRLTGLGLLVLGGALLSGWIRL